MYQHLLILPPLPPSPPPSLPPSLPFLSFLVIREALPAEEKEDIAQQEGEGGKEGEAAEKEKETPSKSASKKKAGSSSSKARKGKKKGALVGIVHFRCVVTGVVSPSLPPSLYLLTKLPLLTFSLAPSPLLPFLHPSLPQFLGPRRFHR